MIFGRAVIILALGLGLGACATYYDDGVRYEDGSYYSPGDGDRGDYYYAPEPSYNRYYYDEFDRFFFDSSYYGYGSFGGGFYGSPSYSYGGYCSARYRYCPPFGYYDPFFDPFPRFGLQISFGDRWYYPYDYGYGYGYDYRHRAPPRRRPDNPALPAVPNADDPSADVSNQPWVPRPVDERPRRDPMAEDDVQARRPEPRRISPPRSERSSDDDASLRTRSRSSDDEGSPRRSSRSSDREDDGN